MFVVDKILNHMLFVAQSGHDDVNVAFVLVTSNHHTFDENAILITR